MIDARTGLLVGAAILSPYLLRVAGAPAYITGGQKAAVASLSASADTQSIVALLNEQNYSTMNGSDAVDFAQRLIAACDAGVAASSEPYSLQQPLIGFAGLFSGDTWGQNSQVSASMPRSDLGTAYDALKSAMLSSDESLTNATDISPAILELATQMDAQGVLVTGKPVTVAGGLGSAVSGAASWAASVAGDAVGALVGNLASALLSTPALILIGGVILYRVAKK